MLRYLPFFWGGTMETPWKEMCRICRILFCGFCRFRKVSRVMCFFQVTLEENFIMSQVIDSKICDMICCEDGWKSYKHLRQIAMFHGDLPWLDKKIGLDKSMG